MRSFFDTLDVSKSQDSKDTHRILRTRVVVAFTIVGTLTTFLFGLYNVFFNNLYLGIFELVLVFPAFLSFYLIRRTGDCVLAGSLILSLMALLLVGLLLTGGIEKTGIFWVYTFPLLSFFILGRRRGLVWGTGFALIMVAMALLDYYQLIASAYTFVEFRQATVSMLVVMVMTYLYEMVVDQFRVKTQLREAELKELNQELNERVRKALEKSRKKDLLLMQQSREVVMGEMMTNIAHRWRQPITALGLMLQNIEMDLEADGYRNDEFPLMFQQSYGVIRNMSETINEFTNFFKKTGQAACFTLNETIESAISIISKDFTAHNITISYHPDGEFNIYGHRNELAQAILNFLTNAKDAIMESGVQRGEVTIDIQKSTTDVMLRIEDNGGGIPEDVVNKIFDPYFTTKEEGKGTGIGLYMAKMLIEKHFNGTITVENTSRGALFTLVLPQKLSEACD